MAQTRKNRILPMILVLVCAAVMLRSAFTGLEIDEEYALSLGYRLVSGDRLFYDMWEPHQLSSLPAAALLAMFIGITGGTTGVLVFFRLVVLVCKAGMSYVFYREFRRDLGKPAALLAALVLFAFVPKWFLGPDYTGQQFHWTLAAFLCLHHYVTRGCKQLWLVPLGAVCACFGYLAFPQSAAAFAVLWIGMLILGKRYGEPKHRGAWVLLGSCAVCGVAFLVYALSGVEFSISLLLSRLTLILHDPQYNFTTAQRMALLAGQALTVARSLLWPLLASAAVCAALYLIKKQPVTVGRLLNLWAAFATVQCLPGRAPVCAGGGAGRGVGVLARPRQARQRRAVLAGLSAGAGGLRHDPAVDAAWIGPDFYVLDMARRLRYAGAGEPCGWRGQCRKIPPRRGCALPGRDAGVFARLSRLVRADNRLEIG